MYRRTANSSSRELQDVCKALFAVRVSRLCSWIEAVPDATPFSYHLCPDKVFAGLRLQDSICQETNAIFLPVQVSCRSLAVEGAAQHGHKDAWAACLDPEYGLSRRIQRKHCRVYSFGCVRQPNKLITRCQLCCICNHAGWISELSGPR